MFSANPEIIADSSSVVHMVWLARMLEEENCAYDTVMYSRIENGRWTPPRDVLLSPKGRCLFDLAMTYDEEAGRLDVVFSDFELYHSSVPVLLAANAAAWSEPVPLERGIGHGLDMSLDQINACILPISARSQTAKCSTPSLTTAVYLGRRRQ